MEHMPEFALREHDYVVGQHKIAGNAQSISGKRWVLHQQAASVQLILVDRCTTRRFCGM